MKKIIILLLITVIIISLFSFKKKNIKLETPPGTYQLDSNFFADVNEIRNVDYREYIFWMKRVFNEKSEQYISSLPDTTVWNNEGIGKHFGAKYFRHPMYQEYPVVGISYQQALNFCKWRSERVNEMILVREGELYWNMEQDSTDYFTINRFLNGKCKKYQKIDKLKKKYQFITYSLPTEKEWNYIFKKSEEIFLQQKISKRKLKKYPDCIKNGKPKQFICNSDYVKYSKEGDKLKTITTTVFSSCFKQQFYNLQGNVAEITSNKTVCGGSWKNTKNEILENKSNKYEKLTNFVGFRCVATWKEYNIE